MRETLVSARGADGESTDGESAVLRAGGVRRQYGTSLQTLLVRTQQSIAPLFREVYSRFGLTPTQWRTMRVLWESDGLQIKTLAERALLDRPVVVGVVDRLERSGLVERERSATDRRRVYVRLTPEGRGLEEAAGPLVDAVYANLDQSLNSAEWAELFQLLERVIRFANGKADADHADLVDEYL